MNAPSFADVAMALVLVAIAIGVSLWWKIPVQKQLAIGSVRAFIQLVAVGFALEYIFDLKSPYLIIVAIIIMLVVGAREAAAKLKNIRKPFLITLTAIGLGSIITLGVMLATKLISFEARYVIPLAGMIISNSMNAATLTIRRISSDLTENRNEVETALSLGQTWRQATYRFQKEAVITGMISMLNFLKTVGIVALPGAMTGMILAGADPLEAVLLQLIVGYMLLSSVTITTVATMELAVRQFFTPAHQYRS